MSYKLRKNHETLYYELVEIDTDQIIMIFDDHEIAYDKYKHLKSGNGFEGNTPNFFLITGPLDKRTISIS